MFTKDSPILLVDDSIAMRETVKSILTGEGYRNISAAENGKEALIKMHSSLQQGKMYKLIFLDWNMPEMDGLAFLKACRKELGINDVAIVMLTAHADQKSIVKALQSGATSYITKPVSSAELIKKTAQVAQWFASKEATS